MTRLASIALAALFLATACTVGEPGEGGGDDDDDDDNNGADAAPVGDDDDDDDDDNGVDCSEPVAFDNPGKHNPGLDCMSCHGAGGVAPRWYAAGTLYTDANGTAPLAGATMTIVDNVGTEVTIITALNGNFWTPTPLEYPLTVKASRCPDTKAMVSTVAGPASCNGCHTSGGSPGRIHLP